jgi:hypothetical protein
MPLDKLIRPLHRQRGRHRTVRVLDQQELADLFAVPVAALPQTLEAAGWRYHQDSAGMIWATDQSEDSMR